MHRQGDYCPVGQGCPAHDKVSDRGWAQEVAKQDCHPPSKERVLSGRALLNSREQARLTMDWSALRRSSVGHGRVGLDRESERGGAQEVAVLECHPRTRERVPQGRAPSFLPPPGALRQVHPPRAVLPGAIPGRATVASLRALLQAVAVKDRRAAARPPLKPDPGAPSSRSPAGPALRPQYWHSLGSTANIHRLFPYFQLLITVRG